VNTTYYSNGKLLISGEYLVLDGALALALPTKFGQSMTVSQKDDASLVWQSFTDQGTLWFKARFAKAKNGLLKSLSTGPLDTPTKTLLTILNSCIALNAAFLADQIGYLVKTNLDFPNDWGLGTSSTLINNIAQWANVDAFTLLHKSFGGSGYDIACARSAGPVLYSKDINNKPTVVATKLAWTFKEQLFFVHLGEKMDSKKGILHYRSSASLKKSNIDKVSEISLQMAAASRLQDFEKLLNEHEHLLASILGLPTIKERLFKEYPRAIKSLGAWGGDFILAVGDTSQMSYFKEKGYSIIVPYNDMIL
jgi:mevalonate kinase